MPGGASNIRAGGAFVEIGGTVAPLRTALRGAARLVKGFVGSVKAAARGVARAGAAMARAFVAVGRAIGRAAARLKAFAGMAARRAILGLGAALGLATREAVEFQNAMFEVWSIMKTSQTAGRQIVRQVRDLAVEFAKSPTEMAKALYQTISAGVTDAADAMFVLRTASKAAVGGLTSTFAAVDALTTVMNSYGMSVSNATKISDMMFTAVREGKTTFAELSSSVGNVASLASQAGVQFGELMAAVATLTKGGIRTDTAMTSLRQTIVSIISPGAEAVKTAKRIGLEFNAMGLRAKGLGKFLAEVKRRVGGNVEVMATLFPNIRALSGVMNLAGSQAGEFAKQLRNMRDSAGATDKAFKIMSSTAKFKLQKAWARVRDVAISLGAKAMPFVVKGAERVADAFEFLSKWTNKNWNQIKKHIDSATTWIEGKLKDFWKWLGDTAEDFSSGPIGDAIAGIFHTILDVLEAALPWLAGWASDAMKSILEGFSKEPKGGGKSVVQRLITFLLDILYLTIAAIETSAGVLGIVLWQAIDAVLQSALDKGGEGIKSFGRSVLKILSTVFDKEDEGGKTILDKMKELLSSIFEFFKGKVKEWLPDLKELGIDIGDAIGQGIVAGIKAAIGLFFEDMPGKLADWMAEIIPGFREWGEMLLGPAGVQEEDFGFGITPESAQEAVDLGLAPAVGLGPSSSQLHDPQPPLPGYGLPSSARGAPQVVNNFLYKQSSTDVEDITQTTKRLARRGRQ